jgi:hypothetical protein
VKPATFLGIGLLLAVPAAACDGSGDDRGRKENTEPAAKRYLVDRTDVAPADSRIWKIETLRDTQTGNCFMVVTTIRGTSMTPTECEGKEGVEP